MTWEQRFGALIELDGDEWDAAHLPLQLGPMPGGCGRRCRMRRATLTASLVPGRPWTLFLKTIQVRDRLAIIKPHIRNAPWFIHCLIVPNGSRFMHERPWPSYCAPPLRRS
jgi:hypothetical protein